MHSHPNKLRAAGSGNRSLFKRDVLSKYLEDDGSLIINADIHIIIADNIIWYPTQIKKEETLINIYKSGAHSDVEFVVGTKTFKAHKTVLSQRCEELYELTVFDDDEESSRVTQVHLENVSEGVFNNILEFVYTIDTNLNFPDLFTAKCSLTVADRFGATDLKLLMIESIITDKFLNPDNAADFLFLVTHIRVLF
jgi:hypothetical protein